MSEHTAEYVLVPDLARRLSPHFHAIIPIFFWSTREGNATARKLMSNMSVRLVTAFPRRPKISRSGANQITMKVNQELLSYARVSADAGIPVFAGMPLVASLSTLRVESSCCWFDLKEFSSADRDYFVAVTPDGTIPSNHPPHELSPQPLNNLQIIACVSQSLVLPWDDAIESLREIRFRTPESGCFSFFGGYKPFHFVLPV
jgi:hypothetical protein